MTDKPTARADKIEWLLDYVSEGVAVGGLLEYDAEQIIDALTSTGPTREQIRSLAAEHIDPIGGPDMFHRRTRALVEDIEALLASHGITPPEVSHRDR